MVISFSFTDVDQARKDGGERAGGGKNSAGMVMGEAVMCWELF